MLLLPLSSPRNRRPRRASLLLLLAAVLLCLILSDARASPTAGRRCPHPLDCAREGRHFCKAGSSHCGPCLDLLEENDEGHCVAKKRHHQTHGKMALFNPDEDERIDYLHSVIAKQEVSQGKPPQEPPKQHPVTSSQTDVNKNNPRAPKQRQKSQSLPLTETLHATTTTPLTVASTHHNTATVASTATKHDGRARPIAIPAPRHDIIIVIMISLCIIMGTVAVILASICFVRLRKESHLAQKVDYPALKGKPPATVNGTSMGDKTLAQSAQMYHYQHQKQQMLSLGNHKPEQQKVPDAEVTSDEDEVGGDFTVYECPGLAPTGEMEVKNPLFDDSTMNYQGNHK